MVRYFVSLFFLFFLWESRAQQMDTTVLHSLFLIGDAGEPYLKNSPIGKILRVKILAEGDNATVVFLGDNIYPRGLPEKNSKQYSKAEISLQNQAGIIEGLEAKVIFIPGNHDWQHWGKKGLQYLENQQQWLDSLNDDRITMLPRNGCPGPVKIPVSDNTLLVILDTQWFLHQWEKPKDQELCKAISTENVLALIDGIFRDNPGKRIILAGHHPLITYGEHGGVFTWKAHIFPLRELKYYLYLPLPVIGSFYPLYRKWFGHIQDTQHRRYKHFSHALQNIMAQYPGAVYVAGHEHALQYIVKDRTHYIVSGSGAKTEFVRRKDFAEFAKDVKGFVQVSVHRNGDLSMVYFQVDEGYPEGKEIFRQRLPGL